MSSSSRRVWVSRCRRPTGWAGEPGSVTSTTSAASRASSSARSTSARRRPISASIAPRAWLAALPTLPRSSGGSSATPRSSCGSSALRPRYSMRSALELVGGAGARDRIRGRVLDLLDAVDHRAPRTLPPSRPWPRSATPSAIGMWRPRRTRRAPHRAAPRAPRRPRASRRARSSSASERPSPAASATRRPGSSSTPRTRASGHREDRAHRGPHGLVPVRIGAARAERDAAGAERQRRAQHGADVARVPDAPQRHAQRAGRRRRPALRVDRRAPACPSPSARPWPAAAARPPRPSSPEPAATSRIDARPARGLGGLDQVLALGDELAHLVAPLAARELADLGESCRCGGW